MTLQGMINPLSDKDYQLVSKTFRRVCELYYENTHNEDYLQVLMLMADLIPQLVPSKNYTNGLTITAQMEILKAKVRSNGVLTGKLEHALTHLKSPRYLELNCGLLVEILKRK